MDPVRQPVETGGGMLRMFFSLICTNIAEVKNKIILPPQNLDSTNVVN